MEPATTFTILIAAGSSVWLLATGVVPVTAHIAGTLRHRMPAASGPVSILVAGVILLAAVRPTEAAAVVPPPSIRLASAGPSGVVSGPEVASPVTFISRRGATVYTVVRGDSLWKIARGVLTRRGVEPTGEQITRLWRAIYRENRAVIGADPDLILPGQILTIPDADRG